MKKLTKQFEEIVIRCRANAIGGNDIWSKEDVDYYLDLLIQAVKERDVYVVGEIEPMPGKAKSKEFLQALARNFLRTNIINRQKETL